MRVGWLDEVSTLADARQIKCEWRPRSRHPGHKRLTRDPKVRAAGMRRKLDDRPEKMRPVHPHGTDGSLARASSGRRQEPRAPTRSCEGSQNGKPQPPLAHQAP